LRTLNEIMKEKESAYFCAYLGLCGLAFLVLMFLLK